MKVLTVTLLSLAALVLQGCAHGKTERKIDEKLTQETPMTTSQELRARTDDAIAMSADLTSEQKERLYELRDSIAARNADLVKQSLKLRAVLVKELIGSDYNAREVRTLKKRIKNVESKRLSLLFEAVDRANAILGRQAASNDRILRGFADEHSDRAI